MRCGCGQGISGGMRKIRGRKVSDIELTAELPAGFVADALAVERALSASP